MQRARKKGTLKSHFPPNLSRRRLLSPVRDKLIILIKRIATLGNTHFNRKIKRGYPNQPRSIHQFLLQETATFNRVGQDAKKVDER